MNPLCPRESAGTSWQKNSLSGKEATLCTGPASRWAGIPLGRHPAGPASRLLIIPTWATSMGQLWMENVMSFVNQLLCYDRSGNIY